MNQEKRKALFQCLMLILLISSSGTILYSILQKPTAKVTLPTHFQVIKNFYEQSNFEEGIAYILQAHKHYPDSLHLQLFHGVFLNKLGKSDEAINLNQQIIQQKSDLPAAYLELGLAYEKQNKIQNALKEYKKAVELAPNNIDAHMALSTAYLALGDYINWAKEYEWRWQTSNHNNHPLRWDGSKLQNKTILLIPENGLGDMIQHIRFAKLIKEQGAQIIVSVPKPLLKLFESCPYIDQVILTKSKSPQFDAMTSLLSLPFYLPITSETIPKPPYLSADTQLVEHWKSFFSQDKNFKIGLCWYTPNDADVPQSRRSMSLSQLAPLAHIPGISWYSLQKEADHTNTPFKLINFPELDEKHGGFMDTAAIMQHLDLVITIDTSIAHLAGALDVPVWVMLPFAADVRWMIERTDTPWYPSMHFFRQAHTQNWTSVVQAIHDQLKKTLTS